MTETLYICLIVALLAADIALAFMAAAITNKLLSTNQRMDDLIELTTYIRNEYNRIDATVKSILNVYNAMVKIQEAMLRYDQTLTEQHKELLQCWESIEERYSDSFEQFKHCSDGISEVKDEFLNLRASLDSWRYGPEEAEDDGR